jgi:hypothetical protein
MFLYKRISKLTFVLQLFNQNMIQNESKVWSKSKTSFDLNILQTHPYKGSDS